MIHLKPIYYKAIDRRTNSPERNFSRRTVFNLAATYGATWLPIMTAGTVMAMMFHGILTLPEAAFN